jgi:hypothetical protein
VIRLGFALATSAGSMHVIQINSKVSGLLQGIWRDGASQEKMLKPSSDS